MCNLQQGRLLCFRRKHLDRAGTADPAAWIWNRFRWSPDIWAVAAPYPRRSQEGSPAGLLSVSTWPYSGGF
jgi:hypothetical protein